MSVKERIQKIVERVAGGEAAEMVIPEYENQGHYATAVALRVAKREKQNPKEVAERIAQKIRAEAPDGFFDHIDVAGPGFINFFLSAETIQKEFARAYKTRRKTSVSNIGKGKRVIVEYSQPNIAKQMHTGHLRTTIIGDALARIHEAVGYRVIRWNYLGDWGTQFGNLIAAYKLWGTKMQVEKNPIAELESLYVRFSKEMKESSELEARGREEFRKLEEGDRENRALWKWFKKVSLREIGEVYSLLGVRFDTYIGEAFFEKKLGALVNLLLRSGVARESEGAVVVPLEKEHLPTALIRKSDGASVYLTRDIAALEYRIRKYKPEKLLYVVGSEQSLHFSQLFAIARLLRLGEKTEMSHVKYGLMHGEGGKKMSTREGTSVPLKELIGKIVKEAKEIVEKKNHKLSEEEKNRVARIVGVGALKYNDLKENRLSDIIFDWKRMLDFSGDSAPYLEYTYARLKSIMRKAKKNYVSWIVGRVSVRLFHRSRFFVLGSPLELAIMRHLFEFQSEVERSAETLFTNNLAKYLYDLAALANRFYESTSILKDENTARRAVRLALVDMTSRTLRRGLELLGIEAPEVV